MFALLILGAGHAVAATTRLSRFDPALAIVDSLQRAGAMPAAFAMLDSLQTAALRHEDADLRIAASLGRARVLLNLGQVDEAQVALRGLAAELRARRDTLALCRLTRHLARADEMRRRSAEARAGFARSLAMASAARLPAEVGWSLVGLAFNDINAGHDRDALAHSRRAAAAFARSEDRRGELTARATLARTLQAASRAAEARREYTHAIEQAHRLGDRFLEAQNLDNLGSLEVTAGDPSKAADLFLRAFAIERQMGHTPMALWSANALAIVYLNQGRLAEADSLLGIVLPEAERYRDLEMRARLLCQMGVVRREQGRLAEAVELGRRAMAYADSIPLPALLGITPPLQATYERMGRDGDALAVVDGLIARSRDRLDPAYLRSLGVSRAAILRRLGRPREALAPLLALAQDRSEIPGGDDGAERLIDLTELARCYRDLGEVDSSLAWFARIAAGWERWRGTTPDPSWREKYDDFARRFTGDHAAALLDPRRQVPPATRVREAFDLLQRFRARTLAERIRGSAATAPARMTRADDLQRGVLRADEVFLDVHALPETTLVFAVTRDAIRAYGVRRAGSLVPRLERLRGLLADPGTAGSPLASEAAGALGAELLGPAATVLPRGVRLVVAAGTLARYPLEQLRLPGEADALLMSREVAWVPSASLFAAARTARTGRAARPLLVVAQSAPVGGVSLPGVRREGRWLAQSFAGAEVMTDVGANAAGAVAARAPAYQVLHIAAHTRSGGSRPWQDALCVGAADRADAWLTAERIARLRLPAPLCVLAGCSTIGGGHDQGETLDGLACAWLAAGARTVLATRWEVDDASMSELMRRFYERLARGEAAGAALRGAQLELRGIPRFAAPYHWAGVLLLGDPDTRVRLTPRGGARPPVTTLR